MAGIYIHVPFCNSKCIYCGFYSVVAQQRKPEYLQALRQEIKQRQHYLNATSISTLYFGGGTPSLLTTNELGEILDHLQQFFQIESDAEITLEANPEQLSLDYCKALHSLGINRLSIGIQSFQDHVLQFMGRHHTAAEAIQAVENARQAGFENISIDLIYGVAERTDEQWKIDVDTALSLPLQHLSCYALTPEENSILYKQILRGKHATIDEEQATRQYQILLELLRKSRIQHYEVSNFAIPGFESRHNSSYWNHTPYLGLGPAAHSFDGCCRQWNPANIVQYLQNIEQGINCEECEKLSSTDLFNEKILLGLRTREGVNLQEIEHLYGRARKESLLDYFTNKVNTTYYEINDGNIRLTEEGLWFADGIAAEAFVE